MVLATLIPCVLCSGFLAEPNAADAWNQFFEQVQGMELPQGMVSEWTSEDQAQYEQLAPLIEQARALALNQHCDWGLDYSAGIHMEITHLTPLRSAVLLIHFSMQGDMEAGDTTAALDGLQSLLGITHQYLGDGTVISSLVASSVFAVTQNNASLIDTASDPSQLETILQSVDSFDAFDPFGIRQSIGFERDMMLQWFASEGAMEQLGVDLSAGQLDSEIASYKNVMDQVVEIIAMPNEAEALAAAAALLDNVEAREEGLLAGLLLPTIDQIITRAFSASSELDEFRALIEAKLVMLRSPNAASYFLQAVEAYGAIDPKSRFQAVQQGEYEILEQAFQLLAKAAAMDPTLITLADDPHVPAWLAPLHAMTIDSLARGTIDDVVTAIRVAGHLSQQDRLAASLAAANIIAVVGQTELAQATQDERTSMLEATRTIPSADAFMLHAASRSDTNRLIEGFEIEGVWKPESIAILAATLTLAREQDIAQQWPNVWPQFVNMLMAPDDDLVIVAAIQECMFDALLFATFQRSAEFDDKLRNAGRVLLSLRQKLTRLSTTQ